MKISTKWKSIVAAAALLISTGTFTTLRAESSSFVATSASSGGTVTSVDGVKMTWGTDTWSKKSNTRTMNGVKFTNYFVGAANPAISPDVICNTTTNLVPASGAFVKFDVTTNGTLEVGVRVSANKQVVASNGTNSLVSGAVFKNDGNGTPKPLPVVPNESAEAAGTVVFDVAAGQTYYVYAAGSKIGIYGFIFTPATTSGTSVEATVTFPMGSGGEDALANPATFVTSSSVSIGPSLSVTSSNFTHSTFGTVSFTQYQPTSGTATNSRNDADFGKRYVDFKFTPSREFKPTAVSFDAGKIGTDDPQVFVDLIDGGGNKIQIADAVAIKRNKNNETPLNHAYSVAGAASSTGEVTLRITIGKCGTSKQVVLANAVIKGSYTSSASSSDFTPDGPMTVYVGDSITYSSFFKDSVAVADIAWSSASGNNTVTQSATDGLTWKLEQTADGKDTIVYTQEAKTLQTKAVFFAETAGVDTVKLVVDGVTSTRVVTVLDNKTLTKLTLVNAADGKAAKVDTLTVGDKVELDYTKTPVDATSTTPYWSSSNPDVATVNYGTVEAQRAGEAVITLTATTRTAAGKDSVVTASLPIVVKAAAEETPGDDTPEEPADTIHTGEPVPFEVELVADDTTVNEGDEIQLVFKTKPVEFPVVWKTSDEKIASVTNTGKVKGVKAGKAVITASVADKVFDVNVTVAATALPAKVMSEDLLFLPTEANLAEAAGEGWVYSEADDPTAFTIVSGKSSTIDPATGEEASGKYPGVGFKNNRPKSVHFVVANVKSLVAYVASTGGSTRTAVMTATPLNGDAITAEAESEAYTTALLTADLDPEVAYDIKFTSDNDMALYGIKFFAGDAPAYAGGTYIVEEAPKGNATVTDVDGVTLTWGNDDTWKWSADAKKFGDVQFAGSATGNTNPSGFSAATNTAPTGGIYVSFDVLADGVIDAAVVVNASKNTYILEDGVGIVGVYYDGSGNAIALNSGDKLAEKYYGVVTFAVKAGKTYHLFCTGSKMGYYGFTFTPGKKMAAKPAFSDIIDDVEDGIETIRDAQTSSDAIYDLTGRRATTLESGKLYIKGGRRVIVK